MSNGNGGGLLKWQSKEVFGVQWHNVGLNYLLIKSIFVNLNFLDKS
ncbi:hypothetical protein HMPREF0204_13754 [Chryseobacterium gleum ATCC 35910]|uniref:Uncharacterized protein n=1 Tax=Chryseobacterium gleum ATCC 35910 TaxID=525257 RepID=A0ABN0ANT9_CHRGE|nr:hypothetical protein HMPREF0204_13754 [Chryseobacterium gleum ATCC 35910]